MEKIYKFYIIKNVLIFTFFFPIFSYILSLILGFPVPYFGDLFLFLIFFILSIFNFNFFKIKILDIIFLVYFMLVFIFLLKNLLNFSLLFGISEIRYVIFIPIFYFLFRTTIVHSVDSFKIYNLIFIIFKINLIICLMEFFLINYSPMADLILNRASSIYQSKDRIYDSIFGTLFKPVGLFPGSGNSSIAISLLLILFLKKRNYNFFFFLSIFIGFLITFTFTSLIVLFCGFALLFIKKFRFSHFILFLSFLFILLFLSPQITSFRSSGVNELDVGLDTFYLAMDVYFISYEKYIEEFRVFPYTFTQLDLKDISNLIGPIGEIYLLRVGIYFGSLLLLVFLVLAIYFLQKIFVSDNFEHKFLYFVPLILIVTSLHYPSINGLGLYILLPLFTVISSNVKLNTSD